MSTLGAQLRHARKQAKMRQEDVAAAIGVARTTIVAIEDGTIKKIPFDRLEAMRQLYTSRTGVVYDFKADTEPEVSHTDCREATGITVGLIDAIITNARVLALRDTSPEEVQQALRDLYSDDDVRELFRQARRAAKVEEYTGS